MKLLMVVSDTEENKELKNTLWSKSHEVTLINNEKDFGDIDDLLLRSFDVFIVELILRWQKRGDAPVIPPVETIIGGVENAGFRVVEKIRKHNKNKIFLVSPFDEVTSADYLEETGNIEIVEQYPHIRLRELMRL